MRYRICIKTCQRVRELSAFPRKMTLSVSERYNINNNQVAPPLLPLPQSRGAMSFQTWLDCPQFRWTVQPSHPPAKLLVLPPPQTPPEKVPQPVIQAALSASQLMLWGLNLVACSIKVLGILCCSILFGGFCDKSFQSMPVDDVNYYLYASVHLIWVYTTSTRSIVCWPRTLFDDRFITAIFISRRRDTTGWSRSATKSIAVGFCRPNANTDPSQQLLWDYQQSTEAPTSEIPSTHASPDTSGESTSTSISTNASVHNVNL